MTEQELQSEFAKIRREDLQPIWQQIYDLLLETDLFSVE